MRAGSNLSAIVLRLSTLILLAACADATRPTDPPAAPPAPAPVGPPAPESVPPPPAPTLSRPGVAYGRVSHSFLPGAQYYVLYDDSTFGLLYTAHGGFEYTGKFSRTDSEIAFRFDANANHWLGPWLAQGILRGDSLFVRYNDHMKWDDFEDGTYVRSPGQ